MTSGHSAVPDSSREVVATFNGPSAIVGASYTSDTPNLNTGVPTQDPFLWHNGAMIDLGNLGGTLSMAQCANNREGVIGASNLPGDQLSHAFLWRNGHMTDLGTLGGNISEAIWINDAGIIAGSADLPTPISTMLCDGKTGKFSISARWTETRAAAHARSTQRA